MSRIAPWMLVVLLGVGGCASTTGESGTHAAAPSKPADPAAAAPAGRGSTSAATTAKGAAPKEADPKNAAKAAPPAAVNSRIGDVRISLFALSKGKMSNEYSGVYLMLVNKSWLAHKRSLEEPFSKITQPGIKIVDDEVMEGLLKHLTDCGFNNMPGVGSIDVAALSRPQVEGVRYITLNRDGQSRTVERARVSKNPGGLIDKFVDMELGVNQVWHSSQTYVTETQKQDWREAFQGYLDMRKAENDAANGTAPKKSETPPPGK